ncbi:MAG: ribosome biogenesis GTP-binding protein YihA/YsxC [Gemmatimonadota bacterium]
MRILSVEFDGAIAATGGAAPSEPLSQVAFAGRSNVGKSSLINRLLGRTRTQMARVSARPGKTREINFYRVRALDDEPDGERAIAFHLVDLPGFGYAKVPDAVREAWGEAIDRYLGGSRLLRGVIQLVDARRPPTADDRRMTEFLGAIGVPVLVVATKMDKIPRASRKDAEQAAARVLGVDEEQVLGFSSVTGEGREELLATLAHLLAGR